MQHLLVQSLALVLVAISAVANAQVWYADIGFPGGANRIGVSSNGIDAGVNVDPSALISSSPFGFVSRQLSGISNTLNGLTSDVSSGLSDLANGAQTSYANLNQAYQTLNDGANRQLNQVQQSLTSAGNELLSRALNLINNPEQLCRNFINSQAGQALRQGTQELGNQAAQQVQSVGQTVASLTDQASSANQQAQSSLFNLLG